MNYAQLRQFEFDLSYLTLLTECGLKPLSRWEKPVPQGFEAVLDQLGLELAYVSRRLKNGSNTTELIFSRSGTSLELYLKRFENTFIDKSVASQQFEGFLFGFPPCCIDSFSRHSYRANDLAPEEQKLLFHWACPNCTITPLLLPAYRQVYRRCQDLFARFEPTFQPDFSALLSLAKKTLAVTTSLALLVSGTALLLPAKAHSAPPLSDDPHWLPFDKSEDADHDFIRDDDEAYLGLQTGNPDTDNDGQLDGIQLAKALHLIYQSLLHTVQGDHPYVVDHEQRGIEQCSVCAATVNMGYAEIINPLERITIEIPYIGLHYLEHGSLLYAGSVHTSGAVSPRKLDAVLKADGSRHRLALAPDADRDQDGLYDQQEPELGLNPSLSDSDQDGIVDGTQLSRAFSALIDSLPRTPQKTTPYREEHMVKGIESCNRCGEWVNMGFVRLINPASSDSMDIPYVALHYLHCGGFVYDGTVNQGEVKAPALQSVLAFQGEKHRTAIENDGDKDGLSDDQEARFGLNPDQRDSDADGLPDGMQLARQLWQDIENLPRQPGIATYRVEYMMHGLETCAACGELVNMGYLKLINPQENSHLDLPYIALHSLQHGSFAYQGSVHAGAQIDARKLDFILHSNGTMHLQPIPDDPDQDGLNNAEEAHFGTLPHLPDSDGDGVYDGVQLAHQLAERLDRLPRLAQPDQPYLIEHLMWGLETCEICGELCNMGLAEIVNPLTADTLSAPLIALHALKHGSFSYDGSIHDGRVDPIHLATVLNVKPTAAPDDPAVVPEQFRLWPNFPNPFNSTTTLRLDLPVANEVSVEIYNLVGQKVRTLVRQRLSAGSHRISWDGKDDAAALVAGGSYLCVVKAGDQQRSIKLVYLP